MKRLDLELGDLVNRLNSCWGTVSSNWRDKKAGEFDSLYIIPTKVRTQALQRCLERFYLTVNELKQLEK